MISEQSQRSGSASTASASGRAIASPMIPIVVACSATARSSTRAGVEVPVGVDDGAVAAEERDQREPLPAAVHQRAEHERAHAERRLGVARDLGRLGDRVERRSRRGSTRRRSPRGATSRPWACRWCRRCRACRRRRTSAARRRSARSALAPAHSPMRTRRSKPSSSSTGRYSSSTIIATSSASSIT